MELKIERIRLRDACKKASKAAGTEKIDIKRPVLSGIFMQADAGKRTLCLTCTDLSSSMVMKLKDVDVKESGGIVIPSKLFTAMLDLLEGSEVEITARNKTVKYCCGYSTVEQPVFDADDYPNIGSEFPDSTIRISGLTLLTKQPQIVAAKASSTGVQNYRGVMLNFTPEKSTASATDGARFSKNKGEKIADGDLNLFIPEDALRKLCGIVNPKDELFIGLAKNKAVFTTDNFVFTTSLIDGDLSRIEKTLSKFIVKYKAVVDAKELTEAVDLCISMVQGVDPCVVLALTDGVVLSVDNENGKIGMDVAASEVISTDGKTFYYHPSFLYEFLKNCKGRVELLFDEKGFLTMTCGNSEYVVCNRTAPSVKTAETNKKGKTAKAA